MAGRGRDDVGGAGVEVRVGDGVGGGVECGELKSTRRRPFSRNNALLLARGELTNSLLISSRVFTVPSSLTVLIARLPAADARRPARSNARRVSSARVSVGGHWTGTGVLLPLSALLAEAAEAASGLSSPTTLKSTTSTSGAATAAIAAPLTCSSARAIAIARRALDVFTGGAFSVPGSRISCLITPPDSSEATATSRGVSTRARRVVGPTSSPGGGPSASGREPPPPLAPAPAADDDDPINASRILPARISAGVISFLFFSVTPAAPLKATPVVSARPAGGGGSGGRARKGRLEAAEAPSDRSDRDVAAGALDEEALQDGAATVAAVATLVVVNVIAAV